MQQQGRFSGIASYISRTRLTLGWKQGGLTGHGGTQHMHEHLGDFVHYAPSQTMHRNEPDADLMVLTLAVSWMQHMHCKLFSTCR